jgi:hypothetical protein
MSPLLLVPYLLITSSLSSLLSASASSDVGTDNRTTNQSVLPTYSPPINEKDAHSQFNTGVFTNTPQYVAVVATGRRSSRFREWRGRSLDSVEEVDEKREELC